MKCKWRLSDNGEQRRKSVWSGKWLIINFDYIYNESKNHKHVLPQVFTSYFDVLVLQVEVKDEPRYMMIEYKDERARVVAKLNEDENY